VPRTEVHFSETSDAIGPLRAKSMSESPFNPVGPAFVNALRDATGIRFTEAPFLRESTSTVAPTVPPGEGAGPPRSRGATTRS
jgi:CO/xanthine dehydrogenase Mo-binding subunit